MDKRAWGLGPHTRAAAACALGMLLQSSCSREEQAAANSLTGAHAGEVQAAAPHGGSPVDGTLVHLEAHCGDPQATWGEVSYKVKRAQGRITKELKVKVENSAAGAGTYPVSVDGFVLGNLGTNAKGDGKLSLLEDDQGAFPEGLAELEPGTHIRVGELLQFELQPLQKLLYVESVIAGPGQLAGKITYKIERLAGEVMREFQVKVDGGQANTSHAVSIDGASVGELAIDFEGRGRLKYSTLEPPPFPDGFREPRVQSQVRVGDLFAGVFADKLAANED